ncbi:MAG: SO_0444 family Cu/Zn efflux transporter [Oligoflexia bacterium]|nr:SO_0444 family Cu/Zn efflux transporter [Oligoflexia bacterium]
MTIILSIWKFFLISAPYLLFGLFVSGILSAFVSRKRIENWLGKSSKYGVLKGAAVGVPLPLCSCAVVPMAATLKKGGATNGATSSFLISTPETGVDSMMMTYAMIDLPMTIIRPVAAFITAITAGFLQDLFNREDKNQLNNNNNNNNNSKQEISECCKCKCKSKMDSEVSESSENSEKSENGNLLSKLKAGMRFSFVELIDDMAGWMLFGILAGALIDYFTPVGFLENLSGFSGRLVVLMVGIPLYICASASTPIAASLMLKGMSPGVALIFLLAGPATNISNIVIMQKYIGKKGVFINVIAISVVSLLLSYIVDYFYLIFNLNLKSGLHLAQIHEHTNSQSGTEIFSIVAALLLITLLLKGICKSFFLKHRH